MFKFLQINCQSSYAVMCDVGQLLCERDCVVALLQEPYASNGRVRGLPAAMRTFSDSRCHATVVVNDPTVECTLVNSTDWGVCVNLSGRFGRVFFVSVYCKFGEPLEPYISYMDAVLLLASSDPVILGLDANASSPMWFSKMSRHTGYSSHTRGEMLAEWAVARDVQVVNEPSEWYTFDGPRGRSDIDVTFVNAAAMRVFGFEWSVLGGHGVSDHNPIEVVVAHSVAPNVSEGGNRWRIGNVSWPLHGVYVRDAATQVPLSTFKALNVEEQVACVNEWVTRANDSMFERHRKVTRRRVKWWTHALSVEQRSLRSLRKRFQRARRVNADNVVQLRSVLARRMHEFKHRLESVKEAEWRSFLERNKNDPWGRAYKIVRGSRETGVCALQVGGNMLTSWRSCVEVLMGEFFPRETRQDSLPNAVGAADPLLVSELEWAFSRLPPRKSPGMDGFTGDVCKSVWRSIPDYMYELYAKCVSEGVFPSEWKCARVFVLLKSPDRIRSNPRSFRGISLIPVLGKVLERVMVERLQEIVNDQMCERQFGFRQGKCVEDAWRFVKDSVETSNSKYVLGVFVDFKGAFDYLSWASVIRRLDECGCRDLALWKSYFFGRTAWVVGENDRVGINVVRGCPQGSICGPFIWNLMMDPLLWRLEQVCKCCAYADDLLIMVEGQSRSEIEANAQACLQIARDWGDSVGVSLAMDKTVSMLLKGRLSASRPPVVRVDDASIRYATRVKYLGITVGERLCFTPHIAGLKDRLLGVVGRVRRILRNEWGLSRRAVRIIYGGLFVACAAYGSSVWCNAVLNATGRKKVLGCQRVIMHGCLPVCRTVSTEAMQVLLGAVPLDLEIRRRAVFYRIRKGLPLPQNEWLADRDVESLGLSECKTLLYERVLSDWQVRWDTSVNGRVTYEFIPKVSFVIERPDFGFNLCSGFLLTGHGSLNAFLHQRRLSDSPECRCGSGEETGKHVLCECPLYDDLRDLSLLGVSEVRGGFDVSRALSTSDRVRMLNEFARTAFARRRLAVI